MGSAVGLVGRRKGPRAGARLQGHRGHCGQRTGRQGGQWAALSASQQQREQGNGPTAFEGFV